MHHALYGSIASASAQAQRLLTGPSNSLPVATNTSVEVDYNDASTLVDLTGFATDSDGTIDWSTLELDLTNFDGVSATQVGDTAVVELDYSNNFSGSDQILWRVSDNQGGVSEWAQINITVASALNGISTTFDALYDPEFALIGNTTFYSRPSQSKPAKSTSLTNVGYTDQRFGTKIFRVTDVADDPASGSNLMRHEYSRKQAFNCDDTKFIVMGSAGYWYLYDATTMTRLHGGRTSSPGLGALGTGTNGTFAGDCEPTWHPTDPNKIWYTEQIGALQWYEFDIVSKTRTTLFDLKPLLDALGSPWTEAGIASWQAEGRPSDDGRWWGLCIRRPYPSFAMIGLICYDLQTNTIVGHLATTNTPNNVTTSPLGNYVIPSWSNGSGLSLSEAASRPVDTTDGTRAYTRDFSSFVQLSYYGEHADTAIDVDGNEVYVSVNYNAAKMPDVADGYVYMRRMDNGVATSLVPVYGGSSYAVHMSGCASPKRPGWFVLSSYAGEPDSIWKDETIMAVELKANPRHLRLAHHQTRYSDYFDEPHATVNRDFTRVLFASNFNTPNRETYMIGLPSWAIPSP